ncbi:hypothetical protein N7467_010434 [Penicillium canescens]|nr:hypothetical protein N7467_010434 [Penicillium canescens]
MADPDEVPFGFLPFDYYVVIIANLMEAQHLQESASDPKADEGRYMSSGDGWAPEYINEEDYGL